MPTFESLTPDIPGVEKFFNDYRALFEKDKNSRREEKVERAVEGMNEAVRLTLERISSLVRDAEEDRGLEPVALRSRVTKASDLENTIIHWTFGQQLLNSFIPVFCGNDYSDSASGVLLWTCWPGSSQGWVWEAIGKTRSTELTRGMIGSRLTPYKNVPTPGPGSSPLARFSMDERNRLRRPPLAPNASPPLIAFTQARCEITARGTSTVVPFSLASCDSMLAIIGPCGHKQRDPALQLFPLGGDHQLDDYFDYGTDVDVGLCSVGTSLALNESRKLAFVGDNDRIKSYQWSNGPKPAALPVHTLASKGYTGSILLRDGGAKLLRSGKAGLAVWDIDGLPTHGPKGTGIVGGKLGRDELNTLRYWEDGEIEFSAGALPTQRVAAPALTDVEFWRDHPNDPHSVIVRYGERFSPSLVSMETQQLVMHFVGHGGYAMALATSGEDPNCFVSGAKDGCARLYDVRLPTPVLAIDNGEDAICSVLYEHIDGHPFVMLGGSRSEQIKVWDLRGPTPLYELSTGNNEVAELAWDASRQTLYAVTECSYKGRTGYHYGYRPAQFKAWDKDDSENPKKKDSPEDDDSDEVDDDGEDESEPDELGRCWPDRAPHTEAAFGYPLDSGEHRIYCYKFKHDADVKVLPPYGDATCNDSLASLGGLGGGMGDLGALGALAGLGGAQSGGECLLC